MASPSVWDHRFGASRPLLLGVEEEYMLVDARTLELAQRSDSVRAAVREPDLAARITPELFQSELEVHTPVCAGADEVASELGVLRSHVTRLAGEQGLLAASAGTHPFSLCEGQEPTPADRYVALVHEMQHAARHTLIFGLHVHVAVDDPDKAIAVIAALVPHLAELLALSASSPFWRGRPTGLCSRRQHALAGFPRSGPPPAFRRYADFAAIIERLEEAGFIADCTRIWWDVRPNPRFGTVEMRVMDSVSRVDDAVALAAYVQALVKSYVERYEAGWRPRPPPATLAQENKWRATRYGLSAGILDLVAGDSRVISVVDSIRRTLDDLSPHARELGSVDALDGVRRIISAGNGAERQLAAFRRTADIRSVTRTIVGETQGRSIRAEA